MINKKSHQINTALVGLAVAILGLTTGRTVEAKTLDHAIENQSETQLVALKFKKFKKGHHGHKKFHHSPKRFKKVKKIHRGHDKFHGKKFVGHKNFHHGHHFR
ncbi:hypothetical protein C1752_14877 [Acaryochloris thomasi RCC1774]|uniref:Uncharacterized protein n=1 Tax=Acaryochloris thomasi RCC1774 TaxID=1764569 RepID=A0A2W1JJ26_9CYAN|nr:hypothetical protein [Acaryochloris thomasi]PZD70264.1 hypothetical protein C1752_14877 [Acaryochloris thomasi RCC1774]